MSSATTAKERAARWAAGLFEELFPEQAEPGVPVLLACDDETLRVVGERLGYEATESAACFASDVKLHWSIGIQSGFKLVTRGAFESLPRPRALPEFFSVLCLCVLAASRMAPDDRYPTMEYYGRLRELLELPGDDYIECFEFIQPLFERLADWLENDLDGRHGCLIVPREPHPRWVGLAVSQTVFRLRDRQLLSQFFAERLHTLDGYDPLRRLQRWSGRQRLTGHALRLLDNPDVADRVRAAIRSAFNSWDGSELVETTSGYGRLWPPTLHLLPYPAPRMHLGTTCPRPLTLHILGNEVVLEPGAEIELPLELLETTRDAGFEIANPAEGAGGVRLPRLGDTVLFELAQDGLVRVDQPAAESVWVLTRDERLQAQLERRRFNDRATLPDSWELFREIRLSELPGVERVVAPRAQEPFRLTGGLRLERATYLSGASPVLEAGDLELEGQLAVSINERVIGRVGSGERLELPAEVGRYQLIVGDGEFRVGYDVEPAGLPHGEATLSQRLDDPRALRTGARPISTAEAGVTICGACVSAPFTGDLPILVRAGKRLFTIDTAGELAEHLRPPTPPWLAEVGINESGRWEIFRPSVAWLITPRATERAARARLECDLVIESLSPQAAAFVLENAEAQVSSRVTDKPAASEAWQKLVDVALELP